MTMIYKNILSHMNYYLINNKLSLVILSLTNNLYFLSTIDITNYDILL